MHASASQVVKDTIVFLEGVGPRAVTRSAFHPFQEDLTSHGVTRYS